LFIILSALLFISSILIIIFQTTNIDKINQKISFAENKISELQNIENNIEYYNELYAYNKLFHTESEYDSKIKGVISKLWSYKIELSVYENEEASKTANEPDDRFILTNDNMDKLDVDEGKYIQVKLIEIMSEAKLPYSIAYAGNFFGGDPEDHLENHFRVENSVFDNQTDLTSIVKTYTEKIDENKNNLLDVKNELCFSFTKGEDEIKILVSFKLPEMLDLNLEPDPNSGIWSLLLIN